MNYVQIGMCAEFGRTEQGTGGEFARACMVIIPEIQASRERLTPPVLLLTFLKYMQAITSPHQGYSFFSTSGPAD